MVNSLIISRKRLLYRGRDVSNEMSERFFMGGGQSGRSGLIVSDGCGETGAHLADSDIEMIFGSAGGDVELVGYLFCRFALVDAQHIYKASLCGHRFKASALESGHVATDDFVFSVVCELRLSGGDGRVGGGLHIYMTEIVVDGIARYGKGEAFRFLGEDFTGIFEQTEEDVLKDIFSIVGIAYA